MAVAVATTEGAAAHVECLLATMTAIGLMGGGERGRRLPAGVMARVAAPCPIVSCMPCCNPCYPCHLSCIPETCTAHDGGAGLTIQTFETFMCKELPDGTHMLMAAPSVTCWEVQSIVGQKLGCMHVSCDPMQGGHIVVFSVSILLVFVYVIGIPALIGGLLLHYRCATSLHAETWITLFAQVDNYAIGDGTC